MASFLRHTPTGDLYPYNENLAMRDDMVAYVPPPQNSVETPIEVKEEEEIVIQPVKAVQPVKLPKELPNLDDL